jgi:hypothetical protein
LSSFSQRDPFMLVRPWIGVNSAVKLPALQQQI